MYVIGRGLHLRSKYTDYREKSDFYLRYKIEVEFSALQEAKAADLYM